MSDTLRGQIRAEQLGLKISHIRKSNIINGDLFLGEVGATYEAEEIHKLLGDAEEKRMWLGSLPEYRVLEMRLPEKQESAERKLLREFVQIRCDDKPTALRLDVLYEKVKALLEEK